VSDDNSCKTQHYTGDQLASIIAPTVTAGQTYFIVVSGVDGAEGNFTLTVHPPAP